MPRSATNPDARGPVRILALDMPRADPSDLPAGVIARATFADLDAQLLARLCPDQILLPLVCASHDATAVVERLQMLAYTGGITVIARPLPNPRMVEAELRALGPGARLTLLSRPLPGTP